MSGRRFAEVAVGEELPPLDVPVTATLIVAGALASRDFTDVHHDAEVARSSGANDVFMNILTTQGFVGRFVTDWAGPEATVSRMAIKLGVPNYPRDTMRLTGRVARAERGEVEVEVRGANSLGDHVTGSVTVRLP